MGRRDTLPDDTDARINLELERLAWVDGDYDAGGAYWGGSNEDHIWRFTGEGTELFIRAKTEAEAVSLMQQELPNAVVQSDGTEEMLGAYVVAALWLSHSEDGDHEFLSEHKDESDIDPATLDKMRSDCSAFLSANRDLIGGEFSRAGHDFWLTRNHHGAGFWDGDWEDGDALTDAAHIFGESDLYIGDDGKIYAQ